MNLSHSRFLFTSIATVNQFLTIVISILRHSQCAGRGDKIVFLASSILRVECSRANGTGSIVLHRLAAELASLLEACASADATADFLTSSPTALSLTSLAHLMLLLVSDAVYDVIEIAEAEDVFGKMVAAFNNAALILSHNADFHKIGLRSATIALPPWVSVCVLCIDGLHRVLRSEVELYKLKAVSPTLLGSEQAVRWEYQQAGTRMSYLDYDHIFHRFSAEANSILEREYARGSRTALIELDGYPCTVDFASMTSSNNFTTENLLVRRQLTNDRMIRNQAPDIQRNTKRPNFRGLSTEQNETLMGAIARLLKARMDQSTLSTILRLCVVLTQDSNLVGAFVKNGGFDAILNVHLSSFFQGAAVAISVSSDRSSGWAIQDFFFPPHICTVTISFYDKTLPFPSYSFSSFTTTFTYDHDSDSHISFFPNLHSFAISSYLVDSPPSH